MAKKNVQPVENDVEIITPDVNSKSKKGQKVDNTKTDKTKETKSKDAKASKDDKNKKPKSNKNKQEKKSFKRKASEVWSELKKVSKPSFGKVAKNTGVVIAVVTICTLTLFGVDKLFSLLNDLLLP